MTLRSKKLRRLNIADIFELHGEKEFRHGEQRVLERLLKEPPHVLATGGGAYLNPETRDLLRGKAITVWLSADIETLWERVSRRGHRPLLKTADPRGVLSRLLRERAPIYSEADITIESLDGPHSLTVNAIIKALKDWKPNE